MHARFVQFRLPRHPLPRLLLALVGIVLLAMFAAVGLVLGTVLLAALALRALYLRLRGGTAPSRAANPGVIEGDFRVVDPQRAELPPRTPSR
jgi:hypothetical protein